MRDTPGFLSEREARFLMTALAISPAGGTNVEIGSFKGRSTVGLATVARILDLGLINAIDPQTSPAATDPALNGELSSYDAFAANVDRVGASGYVNSRRAFSYEVAPTWREPIRFLFVDGDHSSRTSLVRMILGRSASVVQSAGRSTDPGADAHSFTGSTVAFWQSQRGNCSKARSAAVTSTAGASACTSSGAHWPPTVT